MLAWRRCVATLSACLLAAVVGPPAVASSAQPPEPTHAPDRLTIPAPITRSEDGIPLGNGLVGCTIWGEANVIRISLDRGDLWDLRTPEMLKRPDWNYQTMQHLVAAGDQAKLVEMFDDPYNLPYPTKLPVGRIELEFPPGSSVKAFEWDPFNAEASVDLTDAHLTMFVSATGPMMMLCVDGAEPAVRLVPPAALRKLEFSGPMIWEGGGLSRNNIILTQDTGPDTAYAVVIDKQGSTHGMALTVSVNASHTAKERETVAVMTQPVPDAIWDAYARLREPHAAWWRTFWSTSSITIPDEHVQRHYDLCKYFYGAGSSPTAPPMPLQGLWTADNGDLPPWKGDYHNDLNTQMTYCAYPTAGLFDQGLSFLNFNVDLLPRYRRFARQFYGVDQAIVPGVMTLDGSPTAGWGMYALSPTNSAWIAQAFYLHWKYTADDTFLNERAYPWCAEIGAALLALLKPDDHGRLKLPLSSSPEIFDNSLKAWLPPNSNYDLALMRWLFAALAEMADATGPSGDRGAIPKWRAALARLDELDTETDPGPSQHALTFAKGIPYRESHRHFSNAMAIHPLGLISVEGPPDEQAIVRATIDTIDRAGTKYWCGYSFSWFSCMCARAGLADKALDYLQKYQRAFTGPNGFHLNGDQSGTGLSELTYRPFTLEGNFLAMQAIHEMLLQSWGGTIRLFPATPAAWPDASFHDLRAEGGFRISAQRRAGSTTHLSITADRKKQLLRLRDPFPGQPAHWNRPDVIKNGQDYEVTLEQGATLEADAQ